MIKIGFTDEKVVEKDGEEIILMKNDQKQGCKKNHKG